MVIYVVLFFFGSTMASFLNVVAMSLPVGQNWWSRRSACPQCQTVLRPWQLIPIVSFLIQKGRCRKCRMSISPVYFVVEIVGGLLFILPFIFPISILYSWLFFALLLTVSLTDFYFRLVPNKILIAFGIPLFLLQPRLTSAVLGFLFFYGAALLGKLLFKKETIGGGDIKLYFVVGLALSIQGLFLSITIASASALFFVLFFVKNKKQEIPFAPFIAFGSLFAYLITS